MIFWGFILQYKNHSHSQGWIVSHGLWSLPPACHLVCWSMTVQRRCLPFPGRWTAEQHSTIEKLPTCKLTLDRMNLAGMNNPPWFRILKFWKIRSNGGINNLFWKMPYCPLIILLHQLLECTMLNYRLCLTIYILLLVWKTTFFVHSCCLSLQKSIINVYICIFYVSEVYYLYNYLSSKKVGNMNVFLLCFFFLLKRGMPCSSSQEK